MLKFQTYEISTQSKQDELRVYQFDPYVFPFKFFGGLHSALMHVDSRESCNTNSP